jgi:hypothetical protein
MHPGYRGVELSFGENLPIPLTRIVYHFNPSRFRRAEGPLAQASHDLECRRRPWSSGIFGFLGVLAFYPEQFSSPIAAAKGR